MKKFAVIPVLAILLSSCSGWPDEEKEMFHESCMEDATSRGMTDDQAKMMCDCRLEKMIAKYPKVEDALNNIQSIMTDPEIQACQQEAIGETN